MTYLFYNYYYLFIKATIRQEGLINKYKAARKGPITSPRLQDQSIVPITSPRLQDQSTVFNSEANDHVKQVPDKSYASALPASTRMSIKFYILKTNVILWYLLTC